MKKQEIINKRFNKSILGYDVKEVDAFLDEIIKEFDRYEHERKMIDLKIEMLETEIKQKNTMLGQEAEHGVE